MSNAAIETDRDSEPDSPTALDRLCTTFRLTPFERAILLACAGMELDASFATLCAAAQDSATRGYPTFGLALVAFEAPHWSAIAPDAPLRRWRLIEVVSQMETALTVSPLRIDERILHFLTGVQYIDERLAGLLEPLQPEVDLVPSHRAIAQHVQRSWSALGESLPVIQLCGSDQASKRLIAQAACQEAGFQLCALAADSIPAGVFELEGIMRLCEREAAITGSAIYVAAESVEMQDRHAVGSVRRLLEGMTTPLILGTTDRWQLRRPTVQFDVRKPTRDEQRETWQTAVAGYGAVANGEVDDLVSQLDLSVPAIQASVYQAMSVGQGADRLAEELWSAGREQARPHLESLAQRVEPVATWEDIVLPELQRQALTEIAAHVTHRRTVYDRWGLGRASGRGLGISALFAGPSGTGKTMAAEVLANALRLDLYRIDLSSVVSKYIGETEKNLRRVFDAADEGGVILFFDEADALFGRRSEVKDSHDRYANIETSYLLQRMEWYRGVAILATNMRGALDPAFMRRIRFVINFPFPDVAQRTEIWRRVFPGETPCEGLQPGLLARLNLTGGNIRNVALNAAFLAARAGDPVRMEHLLSAARTEYAKLDRPLAEMEVTGWVR
jgi:hypothetical protein